MKPLRVVDTGVRPARWNIAMTAALAELHRAGRIPDTLRFHRYPSSVLLGRNQVLGHEIDAGYCRRNGIEIARRVTGGGAVYMSPGVLAWDIVADRACFGWKLDGVADRVCSAVAAGLARLGPAARFSPPNAIMIGGRKVSGSSGGFDGPSLIHQGTVLIDFDRDEMARALGQQPGGTAPVQVASLGALLGRIPAVKDVQDMLLGAIAEAWGVVVQPGALAEHERELADRLLAGELGTEEFVAGPATGELREREPA